MKIRKLVVMSVVTAVLVGWLAPTDVLAKMYRYQDREGNVFVVDDPGKIPPEYREKTEIVAPGQLSTGADTPPPPPDMYGQVALVLQESLNAAFKSHDQPPVTSEEALELVSILKKWGPIFMFANMVLLLAWLLLIVHGFRNGHPVWAVFILLLDLPAIPYAIVHVEDSKQKALALVGTVVPIGVMGYIVYLVFAWIQAASMARGGSL